MPLTYPAIKTTHQVLAAITFGLFFVRGVWILRHPSQSRPRWMLFVPHVIDTLLLASAVTLVMMTRQYPGVHAWLDAKIVALLVYILLGVVAFRFARTFTVRLTAWIAGHLVFLYIVLVALTRSPLPFL